MQAIQASVLLAHYFFLSGRPIEGRYHADSAVTLALTSNLHRTPATEAAAVVPPSGLGLGAGLGAFALTRARDAVEQGERVRLFWEVFFLDRVWSVALGRACTLADDAGVGAQIDAPWPREIADYEQVSMLGKTVFGFGTHVFCLRRWVS